MTFDPAQLSPDDLYEYAYSGGEERKEPLSAQQLLTFAEADLRDGDTPRHLMNALSNAKKALHLRMADVCTSFGGDPDRKLKSFPSQVEYISRCGIAAPRILRRLNDLRNKVEHEFMPPSLDDVETLIDVTSLFLAATDLWLIRMPVDIAGAQEVTLGGQKTVLRSLSFNWREGVVSLHFRVERSLTSPQTMIESRSPSEQYFECVRFAVKNVW